MSFKFRRAQQSDLPQIVPLVHELNELHHDKSRPQENEFLKDWDWFEVFIVEQDGEILGFLAGFETYQFHSATRKFEINNVHVKETHRRQGIGRILFENIIPLKYDLGVRRFSLGVHAVNNNARAFYESFGFKQNSDSPLRYALSGAALKNFMEE